MNVAFEKLMEDLSSGALSLEAVRQILSAEVRNDPQRTRFWPQRIEAEIARGRITAAVGRMLFDALENFGAEQTMWLDAGAAIPQFGSAASAPKSQNKPGLIDDVEQMRAALFDPAPRSERSLDATTASGPPPAAPPPSGDDIHQFDAPPLGAVINGRYRLVSELGLGGVGHVFRALDLQFTEVERYVTLKIVAVNLRHQPHALEALQKAVVRSQALNHTNIATLHDIDRDGDRVFIVMEPLEGRWLSHLIRAVRGRGLSYERVWPIISGIALGLAHAHERGVMHHDLSPHSVFLCDDDQPKVVGFGLLRAAPTSNESLDVLDTQTLRAYSEAYTADPWNSQSITHPADDLYPLGVMAYELLTGAHPFQRYSLAQARQRNLSYDPIVNLNRRARKLIERCLSFEREVRPRDAGGFVRRMRSGPFERMLPKTGRQELPAMAAAN